MEFAMTTNITKLRAAAATLINKAEVPWVITTLRSGGGKQAPHQPKKPVKMSPMVGVDLYPLEDSGHERTKNNNGIVLPRSSHQDGFESNQDRTCNQQQIGNSSNPAEGRKRIDIYIVRILSEYDTKVSWPKSQRPLKQKRNTVELISESSLFTGIIILDESETI